MTDRRPAPAAPVISLNGIYKSFGGVHALTDASLEVRAGEVHALLGENGAGKSTLVKIIAGAHERDAGSLHWMGEPAEIRSFGAAERLGIHIIYQQLNVLDHLSVAENITLARETSRFGFVDKEEGRRRAAAALARLGVHLDVDAPTLSLRVAEKQLIGIARALLGEVRLLIMDEPTASLGPIEVENLFQVIRGLREQDIAVIYISHKLEEVFRIADRITVLRDGNTVGTEAASETNEEDLIALMVGRRLGHTIEKPSRGAERLILEVESVTTDTGLSDIAFDLRHGEVLGVYGLLGSGRTELARALFGADPIRTGTIRMNGHEVRFASPAQARRSGLGMVSEDRAEGTFPFLTIRENVSSASSDLIASRGWLHSLRERTYAQGIVNTLRIRAPSIEEPVGRLSGGNQQKVVVGRWLMRNVRILILDDPTSGIDVGAKDELYKLIAEMTAGGTSVVMTSSELPELMALCDRMLVLHEGRIVGVLDRSELTEDDVIRMAVTGVRTRSTSSAALATATAIGRGRP